MNPIIKKTIFYSSILIFLFSLATEEAFSQPKAKAGKGPEIKLGEVTFKVREFESAPSRLRMLEIHIEVLNKSRTSTAPPNSIKVVVIPKEVKFSEGTPFTEFAPNPEELILHSPLPSSSGRVLIIGFSLLEAKPESITFEIQINPPDGEKKTVKWEGYGN